MKVYRKKNVTLFLSSVVVTMSFGQNSAVCSGGNGIGSGGKMSYSVGQLVYEVIGASECVISPGVQQPFEIIDISAVSNSDLIFLLNIYPNPVTNSLNITYPVDIEGVISYKLLDLNGKIIDYSILQNINQQISMSDKLASVYFLKVLQDNKEIKTFKIVKN